MWTERLVDQAVSDALVFKPEHYRPGAFADPHFGQDATKSKRSRAGMRHLYRR